MSRRAALPVRHFGSVDVFLEGMQRAHSGDVLVVDNGERRQAEAIKPDGRCVSN